jgi:amino acid transporter
MAAPPTQLTGDQGLVRALGRWDLFALVVNGIVGAGIFGLPGKLESLLGVYGIAAILGCAAIMGLVILCFAEVASRFDSTGGPFIYAGAAFGPFAGFLAGWILWIARITGVCAICSLLLEYLAYLNPNLNQGAPRMLTAGIIVGTLTLIHFLGIKRAALFSNIVTVAKLAPLLLFVGLGLSHLDSSRFNAAFVPGNAPFAQAILLLSFAFVGWESVVVAAGEARHPQLDFPRALVSGLCAVALLYLLIQIVCIGTLPQLAQSRQPIVDASRGFLGSRGALLITVGAAISMLGTMNGAMLTISRLSYAMAAAGQLPHWLALIHPRYRTPHISLILSGLMVFGLTVSSQFVHLLTVSTMSRLLVFAMTCAALPQLRRMSAAPHARFVLSGGWLIPGAALLLILWLLASSTWMETRGVGLWTAFGALFYAAGRLRNRRMASAPQ